MGNAEWAQQVAQDLSSIHLLSPSPERDDKEEILEHCRDTTKLVNQLASALRGLEADVSSLRRENASLRQTMFTALPAEQVQQLLQQADAAAEAMPATQPAPPEPVASSGGFLSSGSSSPAYGPGLGLGLGLGAGLALGSGLYGQVAQLQRSGNPQSARHSTPPPTARLAQSSLATRERVMHASPHFGETPGAWNSQLLNSSGAGGANPQPRTPSPGDKRLVPGAPAARPGLMPFDGSHGSPRTDSSATIMGGPPSTQDTAAAPPAEAAPPGAVARGPEELRFPPHLRGEAAQEAPEALTPWAVDQTFWLGPEVNTAAAAGKVRVLDPEAIVSVNAAVEGLNRGAIKCPEDACIVYSASNRGYFLMYRQGHRDKVCNLAASLTARAVEETTDAAPSRADEAAGNSGIASGGTTPMPPGNISLVATPEAPSMLREAPSMMAPSIVAGGPVGQAQQANSSEISVTSTTLAQDHNSTTSTPPSRAASLSGTILVQGPSGEQPAQAKDPLGVIEELAARGELGKAEEVLCQELQAGLRPNEAYFDVLISAFDQEGNLAKAEEWLMRCIEFGSVPCEASFSAVVAALCQQGSLQRAEELLLLMMRQRIRPSKELFNVIIRAFSDRQDAPKVEEWLLHAGQSGWTPERGAFEAVVMLFAEADALKSEEWLSRGQQTEYVLPDECYGAVVQAFLRLGNSTKVNEWLSRMLAESRAPSDGLLREVISLHIETGDVPRAEAWLTQLAGRSNSSVDGLRTALFDAAMRTGDVAYAERQLAALSEADAVRTTQVVSALIERGDAARAKVLCERYRALGGSPTLELCNAMLCACAAMGDAEGAERAARALASVEPLTESQAVLLRRAAGDDRAADLLEELGAAAPTPPPPPGSPAEPQGLHRERSPAALPSLPLQQAPPGAAKAGQEKQVAGKKSMTPTSTSSRGPATKAASAASAKAQARRGPATSSGAGIGARGRPMR